MPPQMPVEQHAVHKQGNWPLSFFRVSNRAGRGFHTRLAGGIALLRHVILPCRRRRWREPSCNRGARPQQEIASLDPERRNRLAEAICLFQLRGAVLAANLDRLAADLDLDWAVVELGIASSAGPFCHDAIPP